MVRPNRAGSRIVSPSLAYIASRNSYMRATFHFGATNALHGPTGEHLLSTQNNAITLPSRKGATCSRCLLEAVVAVSDKPLCRTCAAEMKPATGPSVRAFNVASASRIANSEKTWDAPAPVGHGRAHWTRSGGPGGVAPAASNDSPVSLCRAKLLDRHRAEPKSYKPSPRRRLHPTAPVSHVCYYHFEAFPS
jgi:hypothetical protein